MLLASAVLLHGALAQAASSSWSNQPAWANTPASGSEASRKTYGAYRREQTYEVSPFSPGSHNVALDVGQVFLMGDLAESYSNNIGSQLHYTYGVSDIFGFDSSLGYSSHADGKFSMTSLITGLRTNLSWYDRVIPYVVFGLGFYKPSYRIDPTTSISPVLFGLHLGPGVDLQITKNLFFGTSLTFHDIFGDTKLTPDGKAIDVGGTYTSFFLHAGVTF